MPFLIDGHNLIGQMADLSLADEHDEAKLVLRLRSYHARTRKSITVVFDHGQPGGVSHLSNAGVEVVFASDAADADRVIALRIRRHHNPRALTVVTSDGDLARIARAHGAGVIPAGDFARRLEHTGPPASETAEKPVANAGDVDEWLRLFGQKPPKH
ncbi:MAG: NYN domain-containing protein [Anaerolineae bacterium]|nr:NYN domain-containing protein [Anaerolineae bacterium]